MMTFSRVENGQVTRPLIPKLTSSHEETNSEMIYHLTNLVENRKAIIHASDTDVLAAALRCLEHIPESINVWLEVALYTKNNLRYTDVRKLFNKPEFHVFNGNDCTAAFSRKDKLAH